jgi:hypothetical protein
MKSKTNETLTLPLPLKLDAIDIDHGGRREVCAAAREGIWPRELHPPHFKTSRGEYWLNNAKANRILTLPSSLQLLTIDIDRGERCRESPAVLGGEISRGTADAIPSNITR